MKRFIILALVLGACAQSDPAEHYGFVARLGRDTVSVERVTRQGNTVTVDGVDRFPRVRQRHTEILLDTAGAVRHLEMDITTPSEPEDQRQRHVTVDVTRDSVHIVKRDRKQALRWDFATGGNVAMAHVPQMYSLYELYFAAALRRLASSSGSGDTVRLRQFYIDREFDRFPLHGGRVRRLAGGKAEIVHDWLSGTGEATLDSSYHLLGYSGARTTYDVVVERIAAQPDIDAIGRQFAALEAGSGGVRQLSVRDTARGTIGTASFTIDYGRPLARGRELVGKLIPYHRVWRTGANAATQFTTSAPITLAGLRVPAGRYTLWTIPRPDEVVLVVNRQTGQWGTNYDSAQDLGRAPMVRDSLAPPVEQFTISIEPTDARHGTLVMSWGTFRWTAPIEVVEAAAPTGVVRRPGAVPASSR
jgi:hypothetical protein